MIQLKEALLQGTMELILSVLDVRYGQLETYTCGCFIYQCGIQLQFAFLFHFRLNA